MTRKPLKKRRGLGEAVMQPAPAYGMTFLQGGNQIQTFVLIVLISIIAFMLVSTLLKVVTKGTETDEEKERKKREEEERKRREANNASFAPAIIQPSASIEPAHSTPEHEAQWLLEKAGYYSAGYDGNFGRKSEEALRRFETDNRLSAFTIQRYGSVTNALIAANPIIRQTLKNKGVLRGAKCMAVTPKTVFA